jgi:hypothetical protein
MRRLAHALGWHTHTCWTTPPCAPNRPIPYIRYGQGPFRRWWTTVRKLRDPWQPSRY